MQHSGGCHCGKVRYEVDMQVDKAVSCNCSICHKRGLLLAFVPADKFKLVKGESELTDYLFHKKVIHHVFCKSCGVESFARGTMPDGKAIAAINLRCVDGFDVAKVPVQHVDGKSF